MLDETNDFKELNALKEWLRKHPAARILLIFLTIDVAAHIVFFGYVLFFQK